MSIIGSLHFYSVFYSYIKYVPVGRYLMQVYDKLLLRYRFYSNTSNSANIFQKTKYLPRIGHLNTYFFVNSTFEEKLTYTILCNVFKQCTILYG